ncbi:hypothetical protein CIG2463D_1752 [Campylobacter iguaniorum]|uniref:Uncharacterized protein n=1 Tax=Campylobacter iguaniorum TaxID=1244531 RepID=A0A076FCN5_9BACT|nr:hypothetical protein [Campylobacter iguaniorum]AII15378.1 hypothetical protein CIG1485E_1555 [Campylobacter iguaniorum]ALV25308.1 hypothetical protein CIG2463D_1752 [Campylobacter iguaniorum]
MKKVLVQEAAEILGITKEAVYNRIRRGSLKMTETNGTKYVFIGDTKETKPKKEVTKKSKKPDDDFGAYLISQVEQLKKENQKLQDDKDELFRQKEQILISKNEEIKEIYKSNDERLRNILTMLQQPLLARQNGEYIEAIDVEPSDEIDRKWINLNDFLSNLAIKQKKLKKLQNYLLKCIGKEKFIKYKNGIIYVKFDLDYKKIKEKI